MPKKIHLFLLSAFFAGIFLFIPSLTYAEGPTYVSGSITSPATWIPQDSPYIVVGDVTVNSGVTLTILGGVQVQFDGNYQLEAKGVLDVQGESGNEVVFTSNNEINPAPGNWNRIYLNGNGSSASVINYAKIDYATEGVYINASTAIVRNSEIRNSTNGIHLYSTATTIENNLLENNTSNGIYVQESSATMRNNTIQNNPTGIYLYCYTTACSPLVQGNTIINNTSQGIKMYGYSPSLFPRGTVITNNSIYNPNYNIYISYSVQSDYSSIRINAEGNWWGTTDYNVIKEKIRDYLDLNRSPLVDFTPYLDAPDGNLIGGNYVYGILNDNTLWDTGPYQVIADVTVKSGITLTIVPGEEVRFDAYKIDVKGTLIAQGTPTEMVRFTSNKDNPAKGNWDSIYLNSSNTSVIKYATVEYANNGIYLYKCSPQIENNLLQDNNNGLFIYWGSTTNAVNNMIINNGNGIYLDGSGAPGNYFTGTISNNSIYDNTYNIYTRGPTVRINAENNWWGTIDPAEIMTKMYDSFENNNYATVDFTPFLDAPGGNPLGENYVYGKILNNTTWTDGDPYIVIADTTVNSGVTLTIEPGVEVKFDGNYQLEVKGVLEAQAEAGNEIIFTSNQQPALWNRIYFNGSGSNNSVINHAIIEYATTGAYINASTAAVKNSEIRNNTDGLYLYYASTTIENNVIKNNTSNGLYTTYGASNIVNNFIENNGANGIHIKDAGNPAIQKNTIQNNPIGVYIQDVDSSYIVTIFGNTITNNTTYGVRVYGYNTTYYPQILMNNNAFLNNGSYAIYATSVSDTSSKRIDAENNWWGTTDVPTIEGLIYDNLDNSKFAVVDYNPFLENFAIFITNNNVTGRFFDPRRGETAAMEYTIDQDAEVTINIYEYPSGNIVRTVIDRQPRLMGAQVEIWDGKDNSGQALPAGLYTYTIRADGQGGRRGDYNPFFTGDTIPKVLNSSIAPQETFLPFKGERVEVRYDLDAPALVTIHYNDSPIMGEGPRPMLGNLDTWDGRDVSTGEIVTVDGWVIMKIYAEPLPENVIVIQKRRTLDVSELITDPYVIRPLNNEVTKIVYTINETADITVKILTQDGREILALLEDRVQREAGSYTLQWNGRTDAGETVVEAEDYRVRVEAVDSFGETIVRDGNIRVMY